MAELSRQLGPSPSMGRLASEQESAPDVQPSSGEYLARQTRGRVLLVDDEALWLRSMSRALRAKGYDVVECDEAGRALALLSSDRFDAVLSDIGMPHLDGMQFLQEIRRRGLEVPVIIVTGEPAVATAIQALEYGAFQYLTKPVDPVHVDTVLDKAVRLHRVAQVEQRMTEFLAQGATPVDIRRLEASFDRVLASLWVAYQPIVDIHKKEILGHEALMRSMEPSLPHPGAILDAAERLGKLPLLGRSIRERAAEPVASCPSSGLLFVNLHTEDLLDGALFHPDSPLSRIASRVVLEITERASLSRIPDLRMRVATLRSMGYRLAVDDLGAGYAGLTSFALIEPEFVKLDMSLIRDVHLSVTKQKLIRSVVTLCRDMGMFVVAEGVETVEERDVVVALGCDLLQGYLFARPGPRFGEVRW